MDSNIPLIAAIDVGTNSFHMVIASVNKRGMMTIKGREKVMVRLGSSGGDMKWIQPDALIRGVEALKVFAALAKTENAKIRAVATSATREANNQKEFLDLVKTETGIEIQVISGPEEGRLTFLGVMHALPIKNQKALVIDIGGGSTETTVGHKGEVKYVQSVKLGAIRLTKQFFDKDNVTQEDIDACRNFIKGNWAPTIKRVLETGFETVIGTAGTIQNLAIMALASKNIPIPEIINGLAVTREDLLEVINKIIAAKSTAEREMLPGIDPKRADIILAGALIVEFAIINLNIQKLLISIYGLREGIVFDTVIKNQAIQEFHNMSHLRYETVHNLCKVYGVDLVHAEHVKIIALQIFDELQGLHNLNWSERELLEAASLLHDVGYHISHDQHHKHSYYLIEHSVMPGFTNSESAIIANIARYHRKSHPKKKHDNFSPLQPDQQRIVRILAGILRIAEGIDRRQIQAVKSVKAQFNKNSINMSLYQNTANIYPDIELWGAMRRKTLLEETFSRIVNIQIAGN